MEEINSVDQCKGSVNQCVCIIDTAQKMKFSITDLITFTEEILNGKLNNAYC